MACPLYVDFTRMCIEKFPSFVKFKSFQTCESEQYVDCPLYQVCTSSYNCEYLPSCSKQYNEKMPKIIQTIFMNKDSFEVMKDMWTEFVFFHKVTQRPL